jgi:hypothetical protein
LGSTFVSILIAIKIEAHGAVAQLGEHLLCKQGVTGSIPVRSIPSKVPASGSCLLLSLQPTSFDV